jgi:hypothetical protein
MRADQAWNPIAVAICSTVATGILVGALCNCSFVSIGGSLSAPFAQDELVEPPETPLGCTNHNPRNAFSFQNDESGTGTYENASMPSSFTFGVFCFGDCRDLQGEAFQILSQVFGFISLLLSIMSTLMAWVISTIAIPSRRNWHIISIVSATAAVTQVPVFLLFESSPCKRTYFDQQCELSTGSYLLIISIVSTISVTIVTQCLEPPAWVRQIDAWRIRKSDDENGVGACPSTATPGRSGTGEHSPLQLATEVTACPSPIFSCSKKVQSWKRIRQLAQATSAQINSNDSTNRTSRESTVTMMMFPDLESGGQDQLEHGPVSRSRQRRANEGGVPQPTHGPTKSHVLEGVSYSRKRPKSKSRDVTDSQSELPAIHSKSRKVHRESQGLYKKSANQPISGIPSTIRFALQDEAAHKSISDVIVRKKPTDHARLLEVDSNEADSLADTSTKRSARPRSRSNPYAYVDIADDSLPDILFGGELTGFPSMPDQLETSSCSMFASNTISQEKWQDLVARHGEKSRTNIPDIAASLVAREITDGDSASAKANDLRLDEAAVMKGAPTDPQQPGLFGDQTDPRSPRSLNRVHVTERRRSLPGCYSTDSSVCRSAASQSAVNHYQSLVTTSDHRGTMLDDDSHVDNSRAVFSMVRQQSDPQLQARAAEELVMTGMNSYRGVESWRPQSPAGYLAHIDGSDTSLPMKEELSDLRSRSIRCHARALQSVSNSRPGSARTNTDSLTIAPSNEPVTHRVTVKRRIPGRLASNEQDEQEEIEVPVELARKARIRRLQDESTQTKRSSSLQGRVRAPSPKQPVRDSSPLIDSLDVQLAVATRPNGAEYGPDEVSL